MADTDKYDIVKSEFRFTKEGRHLLISQEGGIKFAILGYMFIQGFNATKSLKEIITDNVVSIDVYYSIITIKINWKST